MHVWGKASQARMEGLHPDLVKVLKRYIEISKVDSTLIEGVRSDEQCYINFGKGRTVFDCEAHHCPGKYSQPNVGKVTWVGHPLSSNHRKKPDGYGYAVDMYPYPVSIVLLGNHRDWEPLFDQMARDMMQAAKDVGVKIRWGADWDVDNIPRERGETDNPHFELVK